MTIPLITAEEAVADIPDGATLAVGGFGLCGIPQVLLSALHARGTGGLHVISNNAGTDDLGLGPLLRDRLVDRITASYVGDNAEFARQYLAGEIAVELTPQGTLAERMRAGGAGIAGFYTRTGVGTLVADGGLPLRYAPDGSVAAAGAAKPVRTFPDGHDYVLEEGVRADFGLVHAAVADRAGNLRFHATARNFNPLAAMCSDVTVVEAETIVDVGDLDMDDVHLPGIFVDRLVALTPAEVAAKGIERTVVAGSAGEAVR